MNAPKVHRARQRSAARPVAIAALNNAGNARGAPGEYGWYTRLAVTSSGPLNQEDS
jgi:hypothetical protein